MGRELIGKRLLIDVRTEVFRKSDDFVPASVFFNLGAGDEGGILTGVQGAHYDVESGVIGQCRLVHFSNIKRPAFVRPVVHGNGNEDRPHGQLHRQVKAARDGCWHVLRAQRLVSPFYVRFEHLDGAARQKRFCKEVTAVLLPRGHAQRRVAIVGVDEARKPVSHAGNRVQIYKRGPSAGHCVSQPHAYGGAFV
jgi:hypothetical protein